MAKSIKFKSLRVKSSASWETGGYSFLADGPKIFHFLTVYDMNDIRDHEVEVTKPLAFSSMGCITSFLILLGLGGLMIFFIPYVFASESTEDTWGWVIFVSGLLSLLSLVLVSWIYDKYEITKMQRKTYRDRGIDWKKTTHKFHVVTDEEFPEFVQSLKPVDKPPSCGNSGQTDSSD